jgi:hypothetical protein
MAESLDESAFGVCDTYVYFYFLFFIFFGGRGADLI